MKSHTHYLWFNTKQRQEVIDITDEVAAQVAQSGVLEGFALVSAMHITASVFVNDHESGLWGDILKWLEETVAPWDPPRYRHNDTGEDNAAAHLRSLTIGHEVIGGGMMGRAGPSGHGTRRWGAADFFLNEFPFLPLGQGDRTPRARRPRTAGAPMAR